MSAPQPTPGPPAFARIVTRDKYDALLAECERLRAERDALKAAVEQVLIASEDNGDMDDIDWNGLRAALASK